MAWIGVAMWHGVKKKISKHRKHRQTAPYRKGAAP